MAGDTIKKSDFILHFTQFALSLQRETTTRRYIMITTIPQKTTEISTADALWVLIQSQTKAVRKALIERLLAEQTKTQQKMVKESLTRAFEELHAGEVKHDARKLFKK